MKKLFAQGLIAIPAWLMMGGSVLGMCIWFVEPSRTFEPATNMKTLHVRDGENVSITVQPQFSGDATDFALVMPFPAEPTVEEAPAEIFNQLEDMTNPIDDFGGGLTLEAADISATLEPRAGVTIIEERDVGDFSTVTLKADSRTALEDWLDEQGYEITDEKREVVSSYVADGGYFVALKVNMEEADVDEQGVFEGELSPIKFEFASDDSTLPLRLMAGDGSLLTLTVYTICDKLTYIPGADIQFSRKVDASDLRDYPALEEYNAWQKWLARNVIQVDPGDIEQDLELLLTDEKVTVVPGETSVVLNPDLLPAETGVVVSRAGQTLYTDEDTATTSTKKTVDTERAIIAVLALGNLGLLLALVGPKMGVKKPASTAGAKPKKSTTKKS